MTAFAKTNFESGNGGYLHYNSSLMENKFNC